MMMRFAADEAPLVLQGPLGPIPPGWLESYWGVLAAGLVLATTLALLEVARRRRLRPALTDAQAQLEESLRQATQSTGPAAAAAVSRAVRDFLAETDARLAAGLSTQELAGRLAADPVYLPARGLLLTALETADLAKFAREGASPELLITQVREAVARVEAARRAFAAQAQPRA